MIRHVVLLRWRPDLTEARMDDFLSALRSLPAHIDVVRDYRVGSDVGLAEGNWDFAIVADFDSVDDYLTYRDHPAHDEFRREHLGPCVTERAALQYEC